MSVREFALPTPLFGSLEAQGDFWVTPVLGTEIHGAIQEQRKKDIPGYRSEVKLSHVFVNSDYAFEVSGRVDGLIEEDVSIIEEIKSTFDAKNLLTQLENGLDHPYKLQLLTYGYIYCKCSGILPRCQLVVVSSKNRKEKIVEIEFNLPNIESWLERRTGRLIEEIQQRERTTARRKKMSKKISFPFESPRTGQLELIRHLEENLKRQGQILLQAPTGLGKTIGIMYPTLKEALGRGRQTIYLTPKNSQHLIAQDAVLRFQKNGARVKCLTLTAKAKICPKSELLCDGESCEYAKDYYTKVETHDLYKKISQKVFLTADDFSQYAREYEVCPFELSLDAIPFVDLLVCDYNYVFSPNASLCRLEKGSRDPKENPNLIIDEAHNLYVRANEYYSPTLSAQELDLMKSKLPSDAPKENSAALKGLFEACQDLLKYYTPSENVETKKVNFDKAAFFQLESQIQEFQEKYFRETEKNILGKYIFELANYWTGFCEVLRLDSDKFFHLYQRTPQGRSIKITCCDASSFLAEKLREFANIIAFSATLKPFFFYAALSGFDQDDLKSIEYPSPFPKKNRKVLIIPQVSTKYRDREKNYAKIGDAITRMISVRKGNYFVFFPSFEFLEKTAPHVSSADFRIFHQTPRMTKTETESLLSMLNESEKNVLILAVQGGIFSEGVDYPGDLLIGAIVVGPALPNYNLERELIRKYYQKTYGHGFDYAYVYPAMTKVVQAAGRVIRSEKEKGLIVMMDQRFLQEPYSKVLPVDWYNNSVNELVSSSIISDLNDFWKENNLV